MNNKVEFQVKLNKLKIQKKLKLNNLNLERGSQVKKQLRLTLQVHKIVTKVSNQQVK